MISLNLYGKFLATADRNAWIDTSLISSFELEQKSLSEIKEMNLHVSNDVESIWIISCNFKNRPESVGVFATEAEARSETQSFLSNLTSVDFSSTDDEQFDTFLKLAAGKMH